MNRTKEVVIKTLKIALRVRMAYTGGPVEVYNETPCSLEE